MRKNLFGLVAVLFVIAALPAYSTDDQRHRVIVSTDIGGTDPDDFQSMVHLLLYADSLDIEGLISSPFGPGRKEQILEVIDHYEQDFENLRAHSADYPTPDYLRSVTKQGETRLAPYQGYRQPTQGSNWIIERAMVEDPRPLHVLVWGGIEDLAQALHDEPGIASNIRVYWIGGPNKKWSPDAYQYIATHHPELHIVESNATYRGWFVGGNQQGEWGNEGFVSTHLAGQGALGEFFATHLGGVIKMGDTPSVGWLLQGTPGDPSQPGWGGQFVRAWTRPHVLFDGLTTAGDTIEEFGIFELVVPLGGDAPAGAEAQMVIENQALAGYFDAQGQVRFRFSPKGAKEFTYTIRSNVEALNGLSGALTALPTSPDQATRPDDNWPNWWTDNPDPALAEGPHIGAKTVSRWREDFLADFALRNLRIAEPTGGMSSPPLKTANDRSIRILPLGDSITYDNRRKDMRPVGIRLAYRYSLYQMLVSAGYEVDFVGSEDAGFRFLGAHQDDNAGFPGITDDQLAGLMRTGYAAHTQKQVTPGPYLESYPADVILLHIGTNRVAPSPADVTDILDAIRDSDPDVFVIVARIIDRYPHDEVTALFNDNVEAAVRDRNDAHISLVDMERGAGIDYYMDMDDDLHPNNRGYEKMAATWFDALVALFESPGFQSQVTDPAEVQQ
jgi:hypothetical protein